VSSLAAHSAPMRLMMGRGLTDGPPVNTRFRFRLRLQQFPRLRHEMLCFMLYRFSPAILGRTPNLFRQCTLIMRPLPTAPAAPPLILHYYFNGSAAVSRLYVAAFVLYFDSDFSCFSCHHARKINVPARRRATRAI